MELTNTQKQLINKMIQDVELARNCNTVEEFILKYNNWGIEDWKFVKTINNTENMEHYNKFFENSKSGIILTSASSSTLKALEKKGYIEIIEDGKNYIDTVKLLNYGEAK